MASAAASTDEHQLLHHHHHQQQQQQQQHNIIYHVPQHSRREKLRYPIEETSSFPTYYTQNPHHYYSSSQFIIDDTNNYTTQPFTLTLSSSSSAAAAAAAAAAHPAQLGPFTGYTTILSRSRFLEPARKLLEELFDVARAGGSVAQCADLSENFLMDHGIMDGQILGSDVGEHQWRKTRLISMLDEVHRKYKQYYQQVQTVTSLFESVPGLSSAAPYASSDLKVMSKHFWCLKNAISEQLHHINKTAAKEEGFRFINGGIGPHRMGNDLGALKQPHIWRPQRGLPERAVAVLRAWLFEHFLHPYPTDADKQMLAKQTGLTRNQVSNWFINARVRLWKPMVEEVHSLEVRQLHKVTAADKNQDISDKPAQLVPSASTATSSTDQQLQNQHPKRPRDELTQMSNNIEEPYNLVYDGFSGQHLVEEVVDLKGNGSVSLTLGLHQNDGVCLTEPLPLSVVRRFGLGLEECNDAYVIGSFEGQGRNFEKEIGGHYLYDFVG